MSAEAFTWRDGERVIRFGRGVAAEALELLGGPGYTLLTTPRAEDAAPQVVAAAAQVHHVRPGLVDELAGDLLEVLAARRSPGGGERFVALGGGRVVDVAKAVAAARGGRALAVPTTLSGAELARNHRRARGAPHGTSTVRPAVVVYDPALAASQPEPELAASALNALAHAVEGPCTPYAHPVACLAGDEAAARIARAFGAGPPDRDELSLGALLAGYAIDSTGYGLHHVLAQTLVRTAGVGHAAANAVLLPHTIGALAWRFPARMETLTAAVGDDPAQVATRICARTGVTALRELGVQADELRACADVAGRRPELDLTPPRADRAELRALYEHAL